MYQVVYIGFRFQYKGEELVEPFRVDKRIFLPVKLTPEAPIQLWKFNIEMPKYEDEEDQFYFINEKLKVYVVHDRIRYAWKFYNKNDYTNFINKISRLPDYEKKFLIDLMHERINFPFTFKPNAHQMRQLEYDSITVSEFTVELVRLDFTNTLKRLEHYYKTYPDQTKLLLSTCNLLWIIENDKVIESFKKYIWGIHPLLVDEAKNLFDKLGIIVGIIRDKFDKEVDKRCYII